MDKQYGMLIDVERCIGCDACIVACKQENDLPPNLDAVPGTIGFSFIRVETIEPEGEYPALSSMSYRPIPCMHCADPPCIPECPTEAIYKQDSDGVVLINDQACTGCEACIPACPYDVIQFDPESELARKCTFCVDLIERGASPACVDACSGGAIFFGDINDPASEISQIIQQNKALCYRLKPELETGPSISYVNNPTPKVPAGA